MPPNADFLATSVASMLLTRFTRTHERRRIAVVAGRPGVGKTTAIERFQQLNPTGVAVIALGEGPKGGHTATSARSFAVSALDEAANRSAWGRIPTDPLAQRERIFGALCHWADLRGCDLRTLDLAAVPLRTIVFDEAQHLSRTGIEALRALNDAGPGGSSPFPVGLIFVGNHEFALKATHGRESALSDAVRDRLAYPPVSVEYDHVTDDDLALYMESRADFDPGALRLALGYFASRTVNRSFRTAERLLERLAAEVGGARITSTTLKHVLALD